MKEGVYLLDSQLIVVKYLKSGDWYISRKYSIWVYSNREEVRCILRNAEYLGEL